MEPYHFSGRSGCDSAVFVATTTTYPAGGKLSCDYLSMRFSRGVSQGIVSRGGEDELSSTWTRGDGGGGGVSGVVGGRRRGGTGWRMKREREGRVSSSRQKQIAIVCEEPRQCRA